MRTITLTGKARPELFRKTLETLRANELGGWRIIIGIEPGPQARDFAAIAAAELPGCDYELTVNDAVLGVTENPFRTIERAFAAGSELNLAIEEDLLLAPDATALALWYEAHHRPRWLCLSLLAGPCGSSGLLSNPTYPDVLFESRTFNSIGYAVRRSEWRGLVAPVFLGTKQPRLPRDAAWVSQWGWDWSIYALLAKNEDLCAVQPVLARATHNGPFGTYVRPWFHFRAFGGLPIATVPAKDFHLVAVDALPYEIRAHVHLHEEMTWHRLTLERLSLECERGLMRIASYRLARAGYRLARRMGLDLKVRSTDARTERSD
jgi:hypothetical protein